LIASLRQYPKQPLLLPPNGISLAEAKHIGVLTYYLFAMIDLTDDFGDQKFRASLFGRRLRTWSDLPDNPIVHGLWHKSPLQASYYWFMSLQTLLAVFHSWLTNLTYHSNKGFFEAYDRRRQRHLLVSSTIPSHIPDHSDSLMTAIRQYDIAFAARWYHLSTHDAIWTTLPPPGHYASPLPPPVDYSRHQPPRDFEDNPRQHKRVKAEQRQLARPDFTASIPVLEVVVPFHPHQPVSSQLFARLPTGTVYPKFPTPTSGTSLTTLCLRSMFCAPNNCCRTSLCKERRGHRNSRIHIDLAQDLWKAKPESYWTPLVSFLQDPQVRLHLRPSPAFKSLTPGTNWA
jgi:hypothetical protein